MWAFAFLLVICGWIFGLFIDLTGDSGLYAAIARQMVDSDDWLILKINGEPYDQKPHMVFWLAGIGIKLFGNTNFGFKIFLFLFGLSGIYFTYRLGRVIFSDFSGRLAALFVGISQIYYLYFFDIHTDTVLQAAVILSLWQFAEYFKNHRLLNFVLAFTGTGLAMLIKGPVGAVLPFLFVLFSLLLMNDYRQLLHPKWLAGILFVVLIITPSLLHLWKSFGPDGLWFYFIDNNFGRISGKVAGSSTDPFFYVYNMLWAFLPWTVPAFAGLVFEIKSWFSRRKVNVYSASLLAGVLIVFLIYSIARGKAPNYMMMLIPSIAVTAAGGLQNFKAWPFKLKKYMFSIQAFILIVLMILMLLFLHVAHYEYTGLFIVLVVVGGGLTVIYYSIENETPVRFVFASVVVSAILNLYLNTAVLPAMFRYQGARQALHIYGENRSEDGVLKNLQLEEYELYFWAEHPVEAFSSWEEFYEFLEEEEPWVYTNERGLGVVKELIEAIDTVYTINQRGMNNLSFQFINPGTRNESLEENYLIKVR